MAEKQVGVRLSVIDGGKAKAELRAIGDEGQAALNKIGQATRPASAGLRLVDNVAGEMRGRMQAAGSSAGLAGAAIGSLGAAGAIAAGAIGLVSLAFARGLTDFQEAERISIRLESVLKATGYAAGLTADELDGFADSLEKSTLASAEQVKEAAGVLATFRSVGGETFTRTISLAQDLSAVFGQSLSSSATQLGKALEDPEKGLTALSRVGVTFTATQKDMILQMVRVGDQAGAQTAILDVLEKQVGGAGAAEASGLTGAFKRAGDATGNLFEELVRATGAGKGLSILMDELITKSFDFATAMLKGQQVSEQVVATNAKLVKAQDQLRAAQELASNTGLDIDRQAVALWQKEVDRLDGEVNALISRARSEVTEKETATAGRQKAEADARTEQATARLQDMRKEIAELGTPAEKIDAVRKALADTVSELEKLRNTDGSNSSTVDDAIRAAQDLAERRITALRKGDTEANKARNETLKEAEKVFDATRTATEAYAKEMERLNGLLKAGAIDQETFDRAAKKAKETLEASAKGSVAGFSNAVKSYLEGVGDMAGQVEDATLNAFSGIEDALVSLATTGKASMSDLANSIIADFMRIAIRQQILGPLASGLQGSLGSVFSSALGAFGLGGGGTVGTTTGAMFVAGQHGGGVSGEGSFVMLDDPSLYRHAPRHHAGKDPYGLLPGERRAILQEGEGVFTPGQMRALGAGAMSPTVNVTTPQTSIVFRGAPAGTRAEERSDGNGGREVEIFFDAQVSGLMSRPGTETSKALTSGYGARPKVAAR